MEGADRFMFWGLMLTFGAIAVGLLVIALS